MSRPRLPLLERPRKLTEKQEAFCVNYFVMRNGAQAARAAGYPAKTARTVASMYLTQPHIQERLRLLGVAAMPGGNAAVAEVKERLEVLTQIVRKNIGEPVTAGHVVGAIAEMNKMGGDYAPEKHAILGKILIEVVFEDRRKDGT